MAELKPGWQRVKFGEVVRLNKETCKDPMAAGIERVIGLEHLEPGDLRVRSWADVADGTTFTNRVRPGQVLFGKRRAYQRKVAVADFDAVCSGDIYVLESADLNLLSPGLLPFICQTDAFFEHAVGTSAGSLSPRTNWRSLSEFEFSLPLLTEQQEILETVNCIEEAIESLSFLSFSVSRLRSALVEETLARMRQESREAPLPSLCEVLTVGIVVTPAKYYVDDGGVPAVRSLNVWPGRFDLIDMKMLSAEGHAKHCKSSMRAGDVAIVRTGDPGRPGNAAVVHPEMEGWNCIDLILARPVNSIRPEYLECFLNSPRSQILLSGLSPGTKQKHLSVTELSRLAVPVPPLEAQDRLIVQLNTLSKAIHQAQTRLDDAKAVKRQILQSLEI